MTYEYLCTACEHVWEAEQSISEAPLKVCPRCNAEAAKRQVSGGAGFILKGGGWYADLYGSATTKKTPDSSAEPSSGGDSKKSAETKSTEAPAASKDSSKSASGADGATKGSGSSSGSKGSTDSSAA
jgi:putative FmdB family regulatory protein